MKLVYPCILVPDGNPGYSVLPVDIDEATSGETLDEALYMAEDLFNCVLEDIIEEGEKIPVPTPPEKVVVPAGAFMTLIRVDTDEYRKS